MKVLIVDDSFTARAEIRFVVEATGMKTIEATDGYQALAHLENFDDIGLVFCDLNMPGMDGMDFLRERVSQAGHEVPCFILSVEASRQLMKESVELGALGWLIKPIDHESVHAILHKYFKSSTS